MALSTQPALAQNTLLIPNAADVDRVRPKVNAPVLPDHTLDKALVPSPSMPSVNIPEAAKSIHFVFKHANIEGATVFSPEELAQTYKEYQDKEVSLEVAWVIAGKITEQYRSAGYFLSRAYVPEQSIENGVITIKVVEGYIAKVAIEEADNNNSVVQSLVEEIVQQKPVTSQQVESFLLRLNDIPGFSYRGVLSPLVSEDEAGVQMTLKKTESESRSFLSSNNYGSRYLGPTQWSGSYQTSLFSLQQTTVSMLSSSAMHKLKNGGVQHEILITPRLKFGVNADTTIAFPSYTLKPYTLKSRSESAGINLTYQAIRQRQQNLALKVSFDTRNSETDSLYQRITRDQIRTLRANVAYDVADAWSGYNSVSFTFSQGLNVLGASDAGKLDLSRDQAKPNYKKTELLLTRQQALGQDFLFNMSASAQTASGTLYSSEQFGYGGQNFGRAYDSSEITGDHGVAWAAELSYTGLDQLSSHFSFIPYGFYDIGVVWNDNISLGQKKKETGSSAGLGAHFTINGNLIGNVGIAYPLTREISTPIYGKDKQAPRVSFQLSRAF